ncbi:unnamed protein product [Arabidopsis arenosa]|uniref:Retrovirus-related Pol polyprotein from transposon TNT 1-94-like beta-barrel domain-containing protein n=1 Tax=Arabidopsis arenosa TaxID=38785 RepID=A0A8S2APV6_ARAAE|nr:unnamed protein product [Arabidopsis arenosa]
MSNEQEKATFNGGGEGTIQPNEQATGQSSGSVPTAIVLQNEATKKEKSGFVTHDANMAEYKRKGKGKVVHNNKGPATPNKGGNKIAPQPSTSFKKQGEQGEFKKSAMKCTFCHKKGHKAAECHSKARAAKSQTNQANLTEGDLCAVVTEANVVMTNESPMEWWYDTGATTHICINRDMFSTYQKCKSCENLMMGNVSHSKIEGTGKDSDEQAWFCHQPRVRPADPEEEWCLYWQRFC